MKINAFSDSFRALRRLPPLRLCLSSLRAAGPATHTLEHKLSHARNQQTVFIFCSILKKKTKKTKKKTHMQKSSGTYGAHFCTGGLMLLSSLFVLSIIVLKGEDKAEQCLCAAVS